MKGVASAMLPRHWRFQTMSRPVKTAIAAAGVIFGLSGCASHPWGPETEIDKETLACRGYGFYEETPEFAACMKFVSRERSKRTSTLVPQPQGPPVTCQTHGSVTNCQAR
jgi:hypothetical protein